MYKKYAGDRNKLPLADTFLLKVYTLYIHIILYGLLYLVCVCVCVCPRFFLRTMPTSDLKLRYIHGPAGPRYSKNLECCCLEESSLCVASRSITASAISAMAAV